MILWDECETSLTRILTNSISDYMRDGFCKCSYDNNFQKEKMDINLIFLNVKTY